MSGRMQPVVRAAQFVLAHVPDLVFSGSKPRRELRREGPGLREKIRAHLRSFDGAVAYAPNQVMIGNLSPETLWDRPRPWHAEPVDGASTEGPGGGLIDQSTFYAWLARADSARLVTFSESFAAALGRAPDGLEVRTAAPPVLEAAVAAGGEPLYAGGERLAGVFAPGHEDDESLTGAVLLENRAAKITGALALRRLVGQGGAPVDFLLGCGEEAVGDRYQRGGGNLAKAMGELAGVRGAGGADVKAFCAGPVHALIMAGALVQSGLYRRVVVVAGGSLAKIGMKVLGHLSAGYPVLEDVARRRRHRRGAGRRREPLAQARRRGHPPARRRRRTPPGGHRAHGRAAAAAGAASVRRRSVRGGATQSRHHGAGRLRGRAGEQLPDHRGARRASGRDRTGRDGRVRAGARAARASRRRRVTSPRRCHTCHTPWPG